MSKELERYQVKRNTIKVSASSDPSKVVVYAIELMDEGSVDDYVEFLCIGAQAQHNTSKAAVLLTYRLESTTPGILVTFRLEKVLVEIKDGRGVHTDTVATLWKTVVQHVSQ